MARRKIDKDAVELATKLAADDLPDLTEKEQKFLEGLLQNKPATVAYREAFDCSSMLGTSIQVAASRLRHNSKLSLWLSAARKAYLGSAVITIESHARELERLREIAIDSGNVGAAVQAEQLRGKATGLYVDRHMDVTPAEPTRTFAEVLKLFPEHRDQIAQRLIDRLPMIDAKAETIEPDEQ